jgi:ATP/maltotriose-dependent transcriptional regulator MalT
VGEVYVYQRDLPRIEETMNRMREEGGRMDHRVSLVYAQAAEALLTWYSGDLTAGARTLEGAAEAMEELGIPYAAARLRRQHAGRLAELGRREEALAALKQCHEVFARMGAAPELRATRGMYEELEKRPPSKAPRSSDSAALLSAREWQVAEGVARRRSNKQIAEELSIGQRTVERHCHNIYKKLDLEGGPDRKRTLLGDWVREGRIQPPG